MQTLWSLERERVCFFFLIFIVAVVQSLSSVWLLVTPWAAAHQPFLCLWLTAEVCSNSCLLIWWCHPTTSSSVAPFSFCCQSFLASVSFPVSQLSHQMAKVLELQLQHQSFQWVFRVDFLAIQGTLRVLIFILFIYLAGPGRSCGMWDLVPWQRSNPGPLHWESES